MNRVRNILLVGLLAMTMSAGAWDWWPLPYTPSESTWHTDTSHDSLFYYGEVNAVASTRQAAPYLFDFDQLGGRSAEAFSGELTLGIIKPATRPNRWFDYDGAALLSGVLQSGDELGNGYFKELYGHVRLFCIDVTVGIHEMPWDHGDLELTSGNLLFSRHAHPIPRVTIGIDHYTPFPGLYGYFEIRGGLTHGWFGDDNPYVKNTMLHHKFLGGRIGGKLPVNITYEFHHAAQWGGTSKEYGNLGNDWKSFCNVFRGTSGGGLNNEIYNAQGNHLISQLLSLTVKGKGWHVDMYWQNLNEDKPISFMGCTPNAEDGLWGIHAEQNYWPFISGMTLEFVNTTDQSGPFHDRDGLVFGGNDGYYTNSIYKQGWTYFGSTIGSPLCTQDNSRVMAWFMGLKGDVYGFKYRFIAQHSRHYGTYAHPQKSHNTALMLEVTKHVPQAWGLDFSAAIATDLGNYIGKHVGLMVTISKRGFITHW
ncbi:MAG: hypothetical protein II827_04750 [Paludibacteraceae bacterium]|nr:hypothetical protein [Paludibacteraceae bacterium]